MALTASFASSTRMRNKSFLMEGYRSSKSARNAYSPRRRGSKRAKPLGSTQRKRGRSVQYRVERSPSPRRGVSPDPDDDPVANVVAAPGPLVRRERQNHDLEYVGTLVGGLSTWKIPIPSLVAIHRGPDYGQRATGYVRVNRLAFKITGKLQAHGAPYVFTIPGLPDNVSVFNTVYFRFVVVFDKQSDGADPSITYPDVFASGPSMAINEFRLPSNALRYEVLHDQTYRWKAGELTSGLVEVAGVGEPFWYQTGFVAKEEIFIDCDKIVHFIANNIGNVGDILSGNMFYMCSAFGSNVELTVTSRTSFSDNL